MFKKSTNPICHFIKFILIIIFFRIDLNIFDRAILLIRDPLDTFIAEINRSETGSNTENLSDR